MVLVLLDVESRPAPRGQHCTAPADQRRFQFLQLTIIAIRSEPGSVSEHLMCLCVYLKTHTKFTPN